MSNYHNILGVSNTASKREIKKAYRSKAMVVHPDVNDSPEAQKLFIELAEAYDILLNDKYVKSKTTKRKYWDTYTPPTNDTEYEKWKNVDKERREFYKQRAREQAIKNKQVFEREVSNFRSSNYYYPALIFYYSIMLLFLACPVGSLCVPFYIKFNPELFNFSDDIIILMGVCTIIISLSLFKTLLYIKKTIDPYFFS